MISDNKPTPEPPTSLVPYFINTGHWLEPCMTNSCYSLDSPRWQLLCFPVLSSSDLDLLRLASAMVSAHLLFLWGEYLQQVLCHWQWLYQMERFSSIITHLLSSYFGTIILLLYKSPTYLTICVNQFVETSWIMMPLLLGVVCDSQRVCHLLNFMASSWCCLYISGEKCALKITPAKHMLALGLDLPYHRNIKKLGQVGWG